MHNLSGYLFFAESVLAVARTLKGTLIINDGYDYYIDVEMLKYCIGNAKDEDCLRLRSAISGMDTGVRDAGAGKDCGRTA